MSSDHCSRAFGGWLAGCGAATAVFSTFVLVVVGIGSDGDVIRLVSGGIGVVVPLLTVFLIICVLTGIPAAVVIWISEKFGIRSIFFYGVIGAVIGGLIPSLAGASVLSLLRGGWVFLVAGLAAGVTYWFVAGKYAGGDHHLSGDRA